MKNKLAQVFVMALYLYSAAAGAMAIDKPTDAEVAVLPPYCLAKFRGVDVEKWKSALGSIYSHVHHYCGSLYIINRYHKLNNQQDRKYYVRVIIDNIDYMFSHGDQSSALIPEIHFTKGKVLVLDGNHAGAAKEFLIAIQLKPGYVAPYLAMADYYASLKNKPEALKLLQEGIRQIPTSRSLARRYQELGGKLPLPEANPPVAETSHPETQPPVLVEAEKKVVEAPTFSAPKTSRPEQALPSGRTQDKIGSPSNPWCRFCTDDEPAPAGK